MAVLFLTSRHTEYIRGEIGKNVGVTFGRCSEMKTLHESHDFDRLITAIGYESERCMRKSLSPMDYTSKPAQINETEGYTHLQSSPSV
jgi:hypothetical protein